MEVKSDISWFVTTIITFPILYFVIGHAVSTGVLKNLLIAPEVSEFEFWSTVKDNGS